MVLLYKDGETITIKVIIVIDYKHDRNSIKEFNVIKDCFDKGGYDKFK